MEDKLFYVVYRLVDDLDDGQQYESSEDFWVVFNQPVPGDFDADGYIDQSDYNHLRDCLCGPQVPQEAEECVNCDLDDDGNVDLADVAEFQQAFSGAEKHPDPR